MEAKNSFFKRAAQASNFKNVPFSVAKHHQRLLCTYISSGNFFDTTLECGPGIHYFIFPYIINFFFYSAKEPKALSTEEPAIIQKLREKGVEFSDSDLVYR